MRILRIGFVCLVLAAYVGCRDRSGSDGSAENRDGGEVTRDGAVAEPDTRMAVDSAVSEPDTTDAEDSGRDSTADGDAADADGASDVDATDAESSEPFSSPMLGANLNGRPRHLTDGNLSLLDHSETTWVRAFIDVRKKLNNGLHPKNDPDVEALRKAAADKDCRLIVSLKWDFKANWGDKEQMRIPSNGSDEEVELRRGATRYLRNIGEQVDIVVLGNEPMWETLPADIEGQDPRLIDFTKRVKDHLIAHGDHGPSRYVVGSFNQMGDNVASRFEPFVDGMMAWVDSDDDIEGVDVHTHYADISKARNMLEAARRRIGEDGLLLDTEFSPVWRYKQNVGRALDTWQAGEQFATHYGVDAGQTVAEYLQAAKQDRISGEEYAAFLDAMPWYHTDHVTKIYGVFEDYDVAFGGLGFLQGLGLRNPDWTRDGWSPFHINFLYQPAVVRPDGGTASTVQAHYIDEYREYAGSE